MFLSSLEETVLRFHRVFFSTVGDFLFPTAVPGYLTTGNSIMSPRKWLSNFRNTLKYFTEKMSLLGYGLLFPKFKGKKNNKELYLWLLKSCSKFNPWSLKELSVNQPICWKALPWVFTDKSLYENYCAPLKSIMKLSLKNRGCSAMLMIISSVIR